jgi:hypothetical protein
VNDEMETQRNKRVMKLHRGRQSEQERKDDRPTSLKKTVVRFFTGNFQIS